MEDDELIQLKTVYDELWRDAKTMIKDVTKSIKAVAWVGLRARAREVNGPQLIEDLKMVFRYSEDQIYTSLKTLIAKRLITARKRADTIFYAIPFEKAFELLTKVEKEQSQV